LAISIQLTAISLQLSAIRRKTYGVMVLPDNGKIIADNLDTLAISCQPLATRKKTYRCC
jgi:hypothetical protein